jgi:hypothetical protein
MVEIYNIDAFPLIAEWFTEMNIPGNGIGVAVAYSTETRRLCVALGKTDTGGVIVKMEGDPYRIRASHCIDAERFNALYQLSSAPIKRDGITGATDVLDGECYFVKWCDEHSSVRLVLSNPRQMEENSFSDFVERLDTFLRAL